MSKFIIEGGIPLKGEFLLAGAKNAATKMIAAAILTTEPVIIRNVPKVSDVEVMLEALQFLGVKADWVSKSQVKIQAEQITTKALPTTIIGKCQATFLFFGALLTRLGEAALPDLYPVDRHISALEKLLRKEIAHEDSFYHAKGNLTGATITFPKNTHTGTANLLIAGTLAKGKTILQNAAEEPEVNSLIEMLNSMGAKISRTEPRVIEIEGVEKLSGTTIDVMSDRIEAGIIAVAAAVTRGDVLLKGAKSEEITAFLKKLDEVGVSYSVLSEGIRVWTENNTILKAVEIETRPHPGFMSDWVAPFAVLLTQSDGESAIHETIYPNRFGFIAELKKMGAEIVLFNPPSFFHAAKIFGPTPLVATQLDAGNLYDGASLVIAALCAKGISELSGIDNVKCDYENLVEKLKDLGAKIEETE